MTANEWLGCPSQGCDPTYQTDLHTLPYTESWLKALCEVEFYCNMIVMFSDRLMPWLKIKSLSSDRLWIEDHHWGLPSSPSVDHPSNHLCQDILNLQPKLVVNLFFAGHPRSSKHMGQFTNHLQGLKFHSLRVGYDWKLPKIQDQQEWRLTALAGETFMRETSGHKGKLYLWCNIMMLFLNFSWELTGCIYYYVEWFPEGAVTRTECGWGWSCSTLLKVNSQANAGQGGSWKPWP